jgi:hypothetical protein
MSYSIHIDFSSIIIVSDMADTVSNNKETENTGWMNGNNFFVPLNAEGFIM